MMIKLHNKNKCIKVIFLDVDGVFTSIRSGWYNFDIYSVNFIISCAKAWNAKLVISSTWKRKYKRNVWNKIFNNLIHEDFITPDALYFNKHEKRGTEIKLWLDNHPEIEDYLILDDDTDMLPDQLSHFIKTDSYNGLLHEEMIKIYEKVKLEERDLPFPHFYHNLYIHKYMFNYHRNFLRKGAWMRWVKDLFKRK